MIEFLCTMPAVFGWMIFALVAFLCIKMAIKLFLFVWSMWIIWKED